jgi:hypothetical protein
MNDGRSNKLSSRFELLENAYVSMGLVNMKSDNDGSLQEYFIKLTKKQELLNIRYKHFEEWLNNNDFDKIMYRLILEHDEEYFDKCYHNGFMPFPNNKMDFIINYVSNTSIQHPIIVKDLECNFPNKIWEFRGYYFQHVHEKRTIIKIFNKDDLRLLLELWKEKKCFD